MAPCGTLKDTYRLAAAPPPSASLLLGKTLALHAYPFGFLNLRQLAASVGPMLVAVQPTLKQTFKVGPFKMALAATAVLFTAQ